MKKIQEVLNIYNVTNKGDNYYWREDKQRVGAEIHIVIPYGFINGSNMLLPAYIAVLNNAISVECKYVRTNYKIGLTYTDLFINIIDDFYMLPSLTTIFNVFKSMESNIEKLKQAYYDLRLQNIMNTAEDMEFVIGFQQAKERMMSIKDDKDVEAAFKLATESIKEENIFVFYQSAHEIDYFGKVNKSFKIDHETYDKYLLNEYFYNIEFDNMLDLLICHELLHSTNAIDTDVKIINNRRTLVFKQDKEQVEIILSEMEKHFDEIFDKKYINELLSFVGSNFVNIMNNHMKDISYVVKAFVSGTEVFEKEDINKLYEYKMEDFEKLFLDKVISNVFKKE